VPLTGPSHASILTGHTPLGHGYHNNGGFVFTAFLKTAAGEFRQAGYRTAAFVSGYPLDRRFGFDRGFDVYDDHLPRGNDPRRQAYVERFGDATTDVALKWLSSAAAAAMADEPQPWFLWCITTIRTPRTSRRAIWRSLQGGAVRRRDRVRRSTDLPEYSRRSTKAAPAIAPSSWSPRTTVKASASTVR
jgi:arylsulfatase A-like enzyme